MEKDWKPPTRQVLQTHTLICAAGPSQVQLVQVITGLLSNLYIILVVVWPCVIFSFVLVFEGSKFPSSFGVNCVGRRRLNRPRGKLSESGQDTTPGRRATGFLFLFLLYYALTHTHITLHIIMIPAAAQWTLLHFSFPHQLSSQNDSQKKNKRKKE